jgi:hypothetical protein
VLELYSFFCHLEDEKCKNDIFLKLLIFKPVLFKNPYGVFKMFLSHAFIAVKRQKVQNTISFLALNSLEKNS